ncbi:hypothetical protein GCM10010124_04580 [Pilimelia terevasa]|uniref:Uncharacterized protein n=1 Tax=Pilimelia terevasa TaxID=53372 RepID=A0A8J3FEQ2_9ACTN|nr:hypothetical protein [Pilimelia terevasa]GGK15033.1 hypothetical protein GCM10010124_04580 [Pilimelia terevasa]
MTALSSGAPPAAAGRLPALLSVRGRPDVPPGASHLVGLGTGADPDLLRHAVKLGTAAYPAGDAPAGGPWSRWLVWLGDARPPGPPSHWRFGRLDGGDGLLLPLGGGPEWTVTVDGGGRTVVADGQGPRWAELPTFTGTAAPGRDWRLAGWAAAAHHEQRLVGGARQAVLIVRAAA